MCQPGSQTALEGTQLTSAAIEKSRCHWKFLLHVLVPIHYDSSSIFIVYLNVSGV